MRVALFLLLSLVACLVTCCGSDFCTTAVYEAPASGLQVQVRGQGHIPFGRDVMDAPGGIAVLRPLCAPSWHLQLRFDRNTVLAGPSPEAMQPFDWRAPGRADRLAALLRARGLQAQPSQAELDELCRTIVGALSGPKRTVLQGQSKLLKVIEVNYAYQTCPADDSAALP